MYILMASSVGLPVQTCNSPGFKPNNLRHQSEGRQMKPWRVSRSVVASCITLMRSRIRIRIRIKMRSQIWIRIKVRSRIRIRINVKSCIRILIRIEVKRGPGSASK